MAGLVLKLARHERILVNGALIENGDRKAELRILTKDAIVLRERLLLKPETTDTSLGRAALLAQNAVLGLIDQDHALLRLRRDLVALIEATPETKGAERLSTALDHVEARRLREAFLVLAKTASGAE
jgi:flagellar biosynthesis repressor protein FlbT